MKFLVEAHLPPSVCEWLHAASLDARPTRQLPSQNLRTDTVINHLSTMEKMGVISQDTDFYDSHRLREEPCKLPLVRTGNSGVLGLITLFARNLPALVQALENHSLVQLDRLVVRVVV